MPQDEGTIYSPNGDPTSVYGDSSPVEIQENGNGESKILDPGMVADKKLETKKEVEKRRLDAMVTGSSRTLFKTKAVFPFDLFPNQLLVDESKVTFVFRDFFWVERIHSIYIKDISDCICQVSFFFATLSVVDYGFKENWVSISFLPKDEALRARRIIQGLVVAHKAGLEIAQHEPYDLLAKVEELGRARGEGEPQSNGQPMRNFAGQRW